VVAAPQGGRRPPWGGPAPAWAPTLPHFAWSLPPRGGPARLRAAGRRAGLLAPTLPHFVWSLPPKGAQPAFGRPGGGLTASLQVCGIKKGA